VPPANSNQIILNTLQFKRTSVQSPYTIKLWFCLKVAKVDFSLRYITNIAESPSNKIPFIFYRQECLSDSHSIIRRLINDGILPNFDQWLPPQTKVQADLLRHSIEYVLYWSLVKQRWMDHWPKTKEVYFRSELPWFIYLFLPDIIFRTSMIRTLYGIGVSRYLPSQWEAIVEDTLNNLSILLGKNKYIFGDKISTLDFSLYSHLAVIYYEKEINPELHSKLLKYNNLVVYVEELTHNYLPELKQS